MTKLNNVLERFLKEVKIWDVLLIAHGSTKIINNKVFDNNDNDEYECVYYQNMIQ